MKKTVMLMAAFICASLAQAQEVNAQEVPAAVKSAFQKKFPNAKEVKWEKEKGNYEVGFEIGKNDYSALLDASGKILETETEIKTNQLPSGAAAYVAKHYPGQKIKEAAKITDHKGVVTYEAEIHGKDLIFDRNGKFLKEVKD